MTRRGTRGGRSGDSRKGTGQGGIVVKRCSGCEREVLSAHRGEVTPAGSGTIVSVSMAGDVVGRCYCGRRVVWQRELPHVRQPPAIRTG